MRTSAARVLLLPMAAILLVEDRPIDRKFLATLLRSAGHTVSEASDGEEGLCVAEATPPDLVISDILMPTVDGYEFVRRLRCVKSLASTRVIFFTRRPTTNEKRAHWPSNAASPTFSSSQANRRLFSHASKRC